MIRILLSTIGALIVAAPAFAQSDYPPLPKAGPTKPFNVPTSETYRLPNGMQVTLVRFGQMPKAAVNLRVYAGSLNEGDKTGLATLTAQMLREGAGGRSANDIAAAAAGMGGNLSINNGNHETTMGLSVLSERAPDAVKLVGDVARRPELPASELERVRQGLLRSIAVAKAQPQAVADAALAAAYYGANSPYGRILPNEAQVKGYTLQDVQGFYRDNFGAARARLYIAGQFDTAAVKAAIEQAFGDWAPGPQRVIVPPAPKPGPQVILVDRPGASQSTLRLAFPAPVAGSASDIPFRVTNALLGGSFTSRITKNIREEKGYTYSPGSAIDYNPKEAIWEFDADVTTAVTGASLKEVFGEIRKLQNEAVPDEEATGIRTWMAGTFVLQNAGPNGLIGSLATRDFHGLPANWLTSYVPNVLAVTDADLQRLAREEFPLGKMTLVVVGDLAKVEPQLKALPELQGWQFQKVEPF